MCGIAGFATNDPRGVPAATPDHASRLLEHRGPDDIGFLTARGTRVSFGRSTGEQLSAPELLLVHRRLAIQDLSDAGWQPMSNSRGDCYIVFNGEIYNYLELRRELEASGYQFKSRSDTEVLLAAYEEWGEEALRRLIGMFAFAIYDRAKRELFLARDYFGIKPLFFAVTEGGFAFASEIKVLLDCLDLPREANPNRLFRYLRYGLTDDGDGTLFESVKQLQAGHCMRFCLRTMSVKSLRRYWALKRRDPIDISFEEAAATLREKFLNSVALHLRSDVPVGAALSGGIDSSSIVMAMREVGGSRLDLRLFSFVAEDPAISEESWVDLVASACGGHVHKVRLGHQEVASRLPSLTSLHDEPLAGASPMAQHAVFERASRDGVKVMLDGQGADEILGGYKLYLGARLSSLLRQGKWPEAIRMLRHGKRKLGISRTQLLALTADHLTPEFLQGSARRIAGRQVMPDWLNRSWFRQRGVQAAGMNYVPESHAMHARMLRSVETSLPRLLRYEDRNSMAFSIESRVPFLTPDLAEFLFRLPEDYLVSETGESKSVFRAAMRGLTPDAVLDRRDKIGFETDESSHLRRLRPWLDDLFSRDTIERIPALYGEEVRRQWSSARVGQRRLGDRFWRWVNLITWSEYFDVQYT